MPVRQSIPARRIAFISSNDAWGGSEILWSRTAIQLAREGNAVAAFKYHLDRSPGPVSDLKNAGVDTFDLSMLRSAAPRVGGALGSIWLIQRTFQDRVLRRAFKHRRPDLVVISQGLNHDGWYLAATCRKLGVNYAVVSQKASDLYWPADGMYEGFEAMYRHAKAALFVSEHNLTLTEQQLGSRLANGRVVRNPFNANWHRSAPWPPDTMPPRLVCLARLDAREKGHDLLLRVLAMPKWRARDLTVQLNGSGQHERGLKAMAAMLKLENVVFDGFAEAPETVWANAHGLILPSRCEGLPLSLIEAMLHGRIAIATDAGGNREALIEGETGFLAEAATEAALDAALERAWTRRSEWSAMGAAATRLARTLVEPDPVHTFARLLTDLADDQS